jgi:hypothetical protein
MNQTRRNRRRNRWRKKLRSCTQCKHFWDYYDPGNSQDSGDSGWGCQLEDTEEYMRLHNLLLDIEYRIGRERRATFVWNDDEWMRHFAKRCPMYQAFDRTADLEAMRIQNQKASAAIWRSADDLY